MQNKKSQVLLAFFVSIVKNQFYENKWICTCIVGASFELQHG
jgi:hypothetical protein